MLPATKDADLSQGSNVHERETNVAENSVPRKNRRLSNSIKNGTCRTSPDPLQSELNFHPHKKRKRGFLNGWAAKKGKFLCLREWITFMSVLHWRIILPSRARLRSSLLKTLKVRVSFAVIKGRRIHKDRHTAKETNAKVKNEIVCFLHREAMNRFNLWQKQ